jgi:hypothetical protein
VGRVERQSLLVCTRQSVLPHRIRHLPVGVNTESWHPSRPSESYASLFLHAYQFLSTLPPGLLLEANCTDHGGDDGDTRSEAAGIRRSLRLQHYLQWPRIQVSQSDSLVRLWFLSSYCQSRFQGETSGRPFSQQADSSLRRKLKPVSTCLTRTRTPFIAYSNSSTRGAILPRLTAIRRLHRRRRA